MIQLYTCCHLSLGVAKRKMSRKMSRSYLQKWRGRSLSKSSLVASEVKSTEEQNMAPVEESPRELKARTVSISDSKANERSNKKEEQVKLPPLNGNLLRIKTGRKSASHQNLSTGIVTEPEFVEAQRDLSRSRASFIQTGRRYFTEEDESEVFKDENNEAVDKDSKVSRSLPPIHVNIIPTRKGRRLRNSEISDMVLTQYEQLRGLPATEYASKCMTLANNFKHKPWLQQIRQAMAISARGVSKTLSQQSSVFNSFKSKPSKLPPMYEENAG